MKYQLRDLLPTLKSELSKNTDTEARRRFKILEVIVKSPKPVERKCLEVDVSVASFYNWARKLLKARSISALAPASRQPKKCPHQTPKRIEKRIVNIRKAQPHQGPERIREDLKDLFNMECPASTIYNVLKRKGLISTENSKRLTKKHIKRYRRETPGYLQMDFKYVPYKIEDKQYYQLSCVDHHSSWRFIRAYPYKSTVNVIDFLEELRELCPFPIIQIQTDNDSAFTDKFISGQGVTGQHPVDLWCAKNEVEHKLIPVGQKELNGKVENTHKQDDREFYGQVRCLSYRSLAVSLEGYNDRWNRLRKTKALQWLTPEQVIEQALVRALSWAYLIQQKYLPNAEPIIKMTNEGDFYVETQSPKKSKTPKIRTRKKSTVARYLEYLEWLEKTSA